MLQDKHRFTKRYIKLQTNNNTQFYVTGYETCYKTDIWISMYVCMYVCMYVKTLFQHAIFVNYLHQLVSTKGVLCTLNLKIYYKAHIN